MIDETGLSVLPISSLGMEYPVVTDRITTGIPRLDAMLSGKGINRGSSVLVSGTAGSGKTSIAAAFAESVCSGGWDAASISLLRSPRTRSSETWRRLASTWSGGVPRAH